MNGMIIVWLIGFLFCWGMTAAVKDKANEGESVWSEIGTIITLLIFWPHMLGSMFVAMMDDDEEEEQ